MTVRRRTRGLGVAVAVAFMACSPFGCSDAKFTSAHETGDAGDAGAAAPTTLSVIVVTPNKSGVGFAPVPNALVQLEMPGADLQQVTSGADGRATLSGIDWSLGKASITAYVEGFVAYSVVDVTVDSAKRLPDIPGAHADVSLVLAERDGYAYPVKYSGKVLNPSTPDTYAYVTCSRCGRPTEVRRETFAIPGRREPATFYVAEELFNASTRMLETVSVRRIERPAPATDVETFDIDWATAPTAPLVETHARVEVLGGLGGPFGDGASAYVSVGTYDSLGGTTSYTKSATRSPDGSFFDITVMSYARYAGAEPYVVFSLNGPSRVGSSITPVTSALVRDGVPKDGDVASGFLTPPVLNTIVLRGFKTGGSVPVSDAPNGATVRLTFLAAGEVVWTLDTTSDVTSFRVPALPALPATTRMRSEITEGRLQFLVDVDPTRVLYTRTATGQSFVVKY